MNQDTTTRRYAAFRDAPAPAGYTRTDNRREKFYQGVFRLYGPELEGPGVAKRIGGSPYQEDLLCRDPKATMLTTLGAYGLTGIALARELARDIAQPPVKVSMVPNVTRGYTLASRWRIIVTITCTVSRPSLIPDESAMLRAFEKVAGEKAAEVLAQMSIALDCDHAAEKHSSQAAAFREAIENAVAVKVRSMAKVLADYDARLAALQQEVRNHYDLAMSRTLDLLREGKLDAGGWTYDAEEGAKAAEAIDLSSDAINWFPRDLGRDNIIRKG